MKSIIPDLSKIYTVNGISIGILSLGEVRDLIAILLGVVSIISTIIIIRGNIRKQNGHPRGSRRILSMVGIMFLAAFFAFCAGCTTLDHLYAREVTEFSAAPIATNVVYKTNSVVIEPASTDPITGAVRPARVREEVTPEISVVMSPPRRVTNIVERPGIRGAIDTTGALPIPWAGAGALLLGWAYSAYAAFRNRRVARGLVLSVQAGRKFLAETPEGRALGDKFKEKLQHSQILHGVAPAVKALLDQTLPDHKV